MGMEIELQAKLLEKLVPYFDWNKVEADLRNLRVATNVEWDRFRPLAQQSRAVLAEMAIDVAHDRGSEKPNYPPLKANLPRNVAAMMKELKWHHDSEKMEFSHLVPFDSAEAYLKSLRRFTAAVGIDKKLDAPNDRRRRELSYHVHLSRTDESSLTEALAAYNRLMIVRLAKAGTAEELFDGTRVSEYSEQLFERGLVRAFGHDHFEVRRHVDGPEAELNELQELFSLPEKEAIAKMEAMTRELITPAMATKLVRLRPSSALSILRRTAPDLLLDPRLSWEVTRALFKPDVNDIEFEDVFEQVEALEESAAGKRFVKNLKANLKAFMVTYSQDRRYRESRSVNNLLELVGLPRSSAVHRAPPKPPERVNLSSLNGAPPQAEMTGAEINELIRLRLSIHLPESAARAKEWLREARGERLRDAMKILPSSFLAGEGWHDFAMATINADSDTRLEILNVYRRHSEFTTGQGRQLYGWFSYDPSPTVRDRVARELPRPSWSRSPNDLEKVAHDLRTVRGEELSNLIGHLSLSYLSKEEIWPSFRDALRRTYFATRMEFLGRLDGPEPPPPLQVYQLRQLRDQFSIEGSEAFRGYAKKILEPLITKTLQRDCDAHFRGLVGKEWRSLENRGM